MVPQKVFSLWLGADSQAIPETVEICIDRWHSINPDYEIILLSESDLSDFDSVLPIRRHETTIQAYSDVLRCYLLKTYGGVWVDASLFPVRPLKSWLEAAMQPCGFFAFQGPGSDRVLSSWFIAAEPGHYLVERWWDEVCRFWQVPQPIISDPRQGNTWVSDPVEAVSNPSRFGGFPYFWFHYLFARLLENDPQARKMWETCCKMSAKPPHQLQFLYRNTESPSDEEIMAALKDTHVQKLNWRENYAWSSINEALGSGQV